ncbi:MAG: sulfotransferase [Sphingomicrobium sp.]
MVGTDWQRLLEQASGLRHAGRHAEAIRAYERLLSLRPDLPDSWYNLAWVYRQERRFAQALTAYERALALGVSAPEEVHVNRAVILGDHLARSDLAIAELQAALRCNPTYVPALLNLGNLREDLGQLERARAAYHRTLDADPDNCLALARLAGVAGAEDSPELIRTLQVRLSDPRLQPANRADLGFALGRLLDRAGDFDAAFCAYSTANAANRASAGPAAFYDRAAQEQFVSRIIAAFPAPASDVGSGQAAAPLFILGMFRSGSTLTEQILGAHGMVTAEGELELIPNLVRLIKPYPEAAARLVPRAVDTLRQRYVGGRPSTSPDRLRTDKRPDNFLHIGLIKRLFPAAKILHTVRNPLDNLLSLYFLQLDPRMSYAHDLGDAAHWYMQYQRLMAHWQALYPNDIMEVNYERLVANPRPAISRILRFCDLPWQDACLDFHRQPNVVKTASVWQVREPLYRRSLGRWRNYEQHLAILRRTIGSG